MNQIFLASTLFGAMNLAAAIDEGLFGSAPDHDRTLLMSTNSVIPEAATPLNHAVGAPSILNRFDRVVDWNAAIRPFHPSEFTNVGNSVVTSNWFRAYIGIDDGPIELVLESIQVSPAQTIANLFEDCPITVYSDGLMSYGPTRVTLPPRLGRSIERVVHLDLVPGLRPRLLSEFEIPVVSLKDQYFTKVIDEVAASTLDVRDITDRLPTTECPSLVLGQYLGALGLMSHREEAELYAEMVRELAAGGSNHVVFKPHPTAPDASRKIVQEAAKQCGVALTVLDEPVPLELVLAHWRPDVTAGCFSTGLLIAQRFFDLDIVAYGTADLMARLRPFENSNRIPLVIVDTTVPQLDGSEPRSIGIARQADLGGIAGVQRLVDTVAYCMQPQNLHDRRDDAANHLDAMPISTVRRYFHSDRLAFLGVGPVPPSWRWKAKHVATTVRSRSTEFGQSYPTIARPWRAVRRRLLTLLDVEFLRAPQLRQLAKRLISKIV